MSAGCTQSTDGTANPNMSTDKNAATAALWDPCTQISDQTLRNLGVDPATRESGIGGVQVDRWKVCTWHDTPEWQYSLTVWSTTFTVDDLKKKKENVDFVDITIGVRNGVRHGIASDRKNEKCYLAFPASQGAVEVSVLNVSSRATVPPCDRVSSAAQVLVPAFPR
ncbi:DUF3558 domain-containing protein [Nocardia gipuzkoensis]